jgi:ubiquinone/menaquinone biosynthesis C-methylase UbiE
VGFYARYVLPRLVDLAMGSKETTRLRAAWIPQARGEVLEIGIGSGLNLPFYSSEVKSVHGVDPSLELQRIAHERAASLPVNVELLSQSRRTAAASQREHGHDCHDVDTVFNCEWALEQMKRVLNPGGRLVFVEHGRAPDRGVAIWQDRLTPAWEAYRRRSYSKSQGRWAHYKSGIPDLRFEDVLSSWTAPDDLHYQGLTHVD